MRAAPVFMWLPPQEMHSAGPSFARVKATCLTAVRRCCPNPTGNLNDHETLDDGSKKQVPDLTQGLPSPPVRRTAHSEVSL